METETTAERRPLADELTSLHNHVVLTPEGDLVSGPEYPLLYQLEKAVGSSSGKGSGGGEGGSVVDLAALDLYHNISARVRATELARGATPVADAYLHVRARVWLYGMEPGTYMGTLPLLEQWVGSIRDLLNPPKQIPLRGVACRECGADQVLLPQGGEHVLAPAVVAIAEPPRPRAWCRSCLAEYDTRDLKSLA